MIPVTVIDYKAGNLTSVVKALRYLDAEVTVTDRPEDVARGQPGDSAGSGSLRGNPPAG